MKKKSSKSMALSLAAIIFLNTASPLMAAASSYMNDAILKNSTSAGTYKNPMNKASYLYGGNIVYKFKDSASGYTPIISFATPKIKEGCNGISFSGGFLQVLGLDGLTDQIKNAGTAVIYGILVGLIYSLPALEKVFSHIRQWAQWLQQMLRSACSQGMELGKYIREESGIKGSMDGMMSTFQTLVDSGDKQMMEILGNGSVTGTELRDSVKKVLKGEKDKTTDSTESKLERASISDYDAYYIKLGLAGIILSKEFINSSDPQEVKFTESTIVPSGEVQELYTIVVNIFGDLSLDDKSIEFLKQYNDTMQSIIKNGVISGNDQGDEQKISTTAALLKQGATGTNMMPKVKLTFRPKIITDERAANFFIFGSSTGSQTASMEFYKPTVVYAKTPVYGKSNTYADMMFTSALETTSDKANIQWKGLFYEARDKIICEAEATISGNTSTCANSFPLVIPNSTALVNTIKQIEQIEAKRGGNSTQSRTPQSQALIDDYAQHEAYFLAKFILNYIEAEISKDREKLQGTDDIKAILEFEKSFRESKKEIEKAMTTLISNDSNMLETLNERFEKVRKSLREDAVKTYK